MIYLIFAYIWSGYFLATPSLNQSQIIHEKVGQRELIIYLPPGVDDMANLKTVYFLDGQMVFSEAFGLHHLLDSLINNKHIDPIIAVGIVTENNRTDDLVPYQDNWILMNWGIYEPNAKAFSKKVHKKIIRIS